MRFHPLKLAGAYLIELRPFQDHRGLFARTFCHREFEAIGHQKAFVQFNHSRNTEKGTLRGMHYQKPPHGEIKLIRCVCGAVYDVIIDIRRNSPTFLQYTAVELSAENMQMIYIPEGFAHGFQTLADHTELLYHHTAYYTPGAEGGLRFDDPGINIEWPLAVKSLSEKDQRYPLLDSSFKGVTINSQVV
ncbi:MAG: dTDP-4-dehydrorhamnose 3,5-epimerase [Bacteroidota bacterium]